MMRMGPKDRAQALHLRRLQNGPCSDLIEIGWLPKSRNGATVPDLLSVTSFPAETNPQPLNFACGVVACRNPRQFSRGVHGVVSTSYCFY